MCSRFEAANNLEDRKIELTQVIDLCREATGKFGCLVGISGGKDSTAALSQALQLGLRPLAFTIQSGYYPNSIVERASAVAKQMNVPHIVTGIRDTTTSRDMQSYELTASLQDELSGDGRHREFWTPSRLRELYRLNRQHYSVRDNVEMPYVRPCQVCRRPVIRQYFKLAYENKIPVVVLGVNEWTSLGSTAAGGNFKVSGIRTIRPVGKSYSLVVAHLPFLLGQTIRSTSELLSRIGWSAPVGESLVETGANSCKFAAAAESLTSPILGFNPDTTRLAREVTAGFLPRQAAIEVLERERPMRSSIRHILNSAGLVNPDYSASTLRSWRERVASL